MNQRQDLIRRLIHRSLQAHEIARDLDLMPAMKGLELIIAMAETDAANRTPNPHLIPIA